MSKLVFAMFDNENGELHQFAVADTVLAKDAVMAYLETNIMQHWDIDEMLSEHKKDILTQLSAATSPTDVQRIMLGFGFILSLLAVKL